MLNPQFIILAVALLPELLATLSDAVQAVQTNLSDAHPEQKKAAALKAAITAYDALDENLKFPDSVDYVVKGELLPGLIEFVYKGMKHTPVEQIDVDQVPANG